MFAKTKTRNGFTLVELLVVISIIALLLAVLLPSLNKAREAARKTMCLSNCHQWAIAVSNYTLDNQDRFPERFWRYADGRIAKNHNNLVYYYVEGRIDLLNIFVKPYIGDYKITRCPGHKEELKPFDVQMEESRDNYGRGLVQGQYGIYVGYKENLGGIDWGKIGTPEKEFVPPKRVTQAPPGMAVAGCIIKDNVYYDNEWVYYHPHREYVGEEPKGSPNAFADGHASWVDYKDMVVFQAYTRHSAYTRNWWPHPYKSH